MCGIVIQGSQRSRHYGNSQASKRLDAHFSRFMLELNKEQCQAFNEKIVEMANNSGLKLKVFPGQQVSSDVEHLVFERK